MFMSIFKVKKEIQRVKYVFRLHKNCHMYIGYTTLELIFWPKNNIIQFCEERKRSKNFVGINFKYFHIYEDKNYILAKSKILKLFVYLMHCTYQKISRED